MGTHDIHVALDWLSWRLAPATKRYSREYCDGAAMRKLQEIATSPHACQEVIEKANAALATIRSPLGDGTADKACAGVCKFIIQAAKEEDFMEMLAHNPQKILTWRKLWNSIRAGKIHRI